MVSSTLYNTAAKMLGGPIYLILFLNDTCWLKCKHCWFHEDWKKDNLRTWGPVTIDRESFQKAGSVSSLSFDELEKVAGSLRHLRFLSLTGGEAFARIDLVDVAEMLVRKTGVPRYDIPTSGLKTELIVSKTVQLLERNKGVPFRVSVSLDGTEDTHDSIRGMSGSYQAALATFKELKKLQKRYAYLDVALLTTVSGFNQEEIEDIGAVVAEHNPDGEWMVNLARGDARDPIARNVRRERYLAAHQLIERRIAAKSYGGHKGHLGSSFLSAKNAARRRIISSIIAGGESGGGCTAGTIAAVLYNNGDVRPCEMLDASFGNVRENNYDVRKIWTSTEAIRMRRQIQETKCTCTHECFLSTTMLARPKYWPMIFTEWLRMARINA